MSEAKTALEELIEAARTHAMTDEEREEQRRSFVYGNCSISNPDVTRELVDEVADELERLKSTNSMKKPKLKTKTYYDYSELRAYLQAKYKVNLHDFAKAHRHFGQWHKKRGLPQIDPAGDNMGSSQIWFAEYKVDPEGEATRPPYQNFWHWMIEQHEIRRGGILRFRPGQILKEERDEHPEFVLTILGWIREEFGDTFNLWTDW